jgi:hypothetical protein
VRGGRPTRKSCHPLSKILKRKLLFHIFFSAKHFARIPQLEVNIEDEGNRLRSDFNTYISGLVAKMSDKREQDEMNIIGMRG